MQMTRRSFLKSLAALAGVSAVPALGVSLPSATEPVTWIIEGQDFDRVLAVACQWPSGIRYAVQIDWPSDKYRAFAIESCKQALRQWYYERHILKRAA